MNPSVKKNIRDMNEKFNETWIKSCSLNCQLKIFSKKYMLRLGDFMVSYLLLEISTLGLPWQTDPGEVYTYRFHFRRIVYIYIYISEKDHKALNRRIWQMMTPLRKKNTKKIILVLFTRSKKIKAICWNLHEYLDSKSLGKMGAARAKNQCKGWQFAEIGHKKAHDCF